MAHLGHNIELLTTGPLEANTAAVSTVPLGTLTMKAFDRGFPDLLARSHDLEAHLAATPFQLIHSHGLWQRPLHYAHRAAIATGVPLVISPRGMMSPWAWRHRGWKKRLASWWIHPGAFNAAAGWHATCDAEAEDIRGLGFRQPICVAPNGVESPSTSVEAEEADHWRTCTAELIGKRVALFYSRFHAKNGSSN